MASSKPYRQQIDDLEEEVGFAYILEVLADRAGDLGLPRLREELEMVCAGVRNNSYD